MKCAEVRCSANRDVMETLSGGVTEGSWAKEGVMWRRGGRSEWNLKQHFALTENDGVSNVE